MSGAATSAREVRINSYIHRMYVAGAFGISDVLRQYRRTLLGPIWVIAGVGIWVSAMAAVFSILFNQDLKTFFPYVSVGMLSWMIVTNMLNEGCTAYIAGEDLIKALPLPRSFFLVKVCAKNFFIGAHYLALAILINTAVTREINPSIILLIPGILTVALIAYEMIAILSYLNAKYRDVGPLVALSMQIIPLLTPVAWRPEMLGKYRAYGEANPIYHLVQVLRGPIIGEDVALKSYLILGTTMVLLLPLARAALARARREIFFLL